MVAFAGNATPVIRENPVRTPISMIWTLGATTTPLDPALNGLEWTLFVWGESLSDPQQASHTRRKCWYRMQAGGYYAAIR